MDDLLSMVGEIRMFTGTNSPKGWIFCRGQTLQIAQYANLYKIIGTTYGGDGQTTFALPNLIGKVPIHQGQGAGLSDYKLGQSGGEESVSLKTEEIPAHTHEVDSSTQSNLQLTLDMTAQLQASDDKGTTNEPNGNLLANTFGFDREYLATGSSADMANDAIEIKASGTLVGNTKLTGQGYAHNNMQPYLPVNFIIAATGYIPRF